MGFVEVRVLFLYKITRCICETLELINLDALKKIVGPAPYLRGEKLFALGAVKLGKVVDDSVTAKVQGTHVYSVTLDWKNQSIKASCPCIAFSYKRFCKHCVAVALCVKYPELASEKNLITDDQKIETYLSTLQKSELLSALKTIAFDDERVYKQFLLKAELANKPFDEKDVKKLITKALPKRSMWDSNKVENYFANAETILDIFSAQLINVTAEQQLALWQKCMDRLNQVLEQIDDSYGYRESVERIIAFGTISAFKALPWSDKQKAQWLFTQFSDKSDITLAIPGNFELTDSVNNEFLALCQFAFDEYPMADRLADRKFNYDMHLLGKVLLERAKADNNLQQQIRLLAKMARTINDYLAIGELCLTHDDELSSEDWLLRAKLEIKGDKDLQAWLSLAINIEFANNDNNLAWQYAWQQFELLPHFVGYEKLVRIAEKAQVDLTRLEATIEQALQENNKAYVTDVVAYYIYHKQTDKLVDWCNAHTLDVATNMSVGEYLMANQPEIALGYFQEGFNQMLVRADNRVYKHVVNELQKLSAGVKEGAIQHSVIVHLVASIKQTHKAKTNLMKLFQQHLGQFLA